MVEHIGRKLDGSAGSKVKNNPETASHDKRVSLPADRFHSPIVSPQRVFLAVGFIFGITFLVVTPPFLAPDEWNHFRRAYSASEGNLKAERILGAGARGVGAYLPEGVRAVINLARLNLPYTEDNVRQLPQLEKHIDDKSLSERRFSKDNLLSLFAMPAARHIPFSKNRLFIPFPNTAVYSPHLYFPQAVGIALGRLLGLPMIALLYAGRFFNLMVWLSLIYLAIRSTPMLKWLFLLYALTPTSLFLASSLSADALTNALSILLLAVCLKYAYDARERKARLTIVFALSVLVSLSKLYFQLIFLYLLFPQEKLGSSRRYWWNFVFLIILAAGSVFLLLYYTHDIYVPLKAGVSPLAQINYLSGHPISYLSAICNSLLDTLSDYVITFVGMLGHYRHLLPGWLVVIHMSLLTLIALVDGDDSIVMPVKDRAVLLSVFLLGSLWVFTSQYLSWTPVGSVVVEGVTGRYFLPVMLPFFLLFYKRRFISGIYKKKINWAITCYVVYVLSFSVHVILNEYYL